MWLNQYRKGLWWISKTVINIHIRIQELENEKDNLLRKCTNLKEIRNKEADFYKKRIYELENNPETITKETY